MGGSATSEASRLADRQQRRTSTGPGGRSGRWSAPACQRLACRASSAPAAAASPHTHLEAIRETLGEVLKSSGSSKRAAERSVLSSRPAPNTAGGVTIASATASASASAGNVAAVAGAPAAGRRRDGLRARVFRAAMAPSCRARPHGGIRERARPRAPCGGTQPRFAQQNAFGTAFERIPTAPS